MDPKLGPEMKSTGEVMGLDADFPRSFAKSQEAAGMLPADRRARSSSACATRTSPRSCRWRAPCASSDSPWWPRAAPPTSLTRHGLEAARVAKVGEGKPGRRGPHEAADLVLGHQHPSGKRSRADGYAIRRTALELNIPCITNLHSAGAAVHAIAVLQGASMGVKSLQAHYETLPL